MTVQTASSEDVLTAADALKVLASAQDAACPVHTLGPAATFAYGPVAALRPYGHPEAASNLSPGRRAKQTVDSLIMDACSTDSIECTCDNEQRHPLAVVIPSISDGAVIRMHLNSRQAQVDVADAVRSADVDRLTHCLSAHLDAVKSLVDFVRAAEGGTLPAPVQAAATVLVRAMCGPSRWDLRGGYAQWRWSEHWRPGVVFERADEFLKHEVVREAVLRRVLSGC